MCVAEQYSTLANFLAAWFPEADLDGLSDEDVGKRFALTRRAGALSTTTQPAWPVLDERELPWEFWSREANRHFESPDAGRAWMHRIANLLERYAHNSKE